MVTTNTQAPENNHDLANKSTSRVHDAVDKVADHARNAEEKIRKAASTSAEALEDSRDYAQHQFDTTVARSRSIVAENPLASAGIAFFAGLIVSSILSRR